MFRKFELLFSSRYVPSLQRLLPTSFGPRVEGLGSGICTEFYEDDMGITTSYAPVGSFTLRDVLPNMVACV